MNIVRAVACWKFSSDYGNKACEYIEKAISDLQWLVCLSDLHDSSIEILNLNVPYTVRVRTSNTEPSRRWSKSSDSQVTTIEFELRTAP